MLPLFRPPAAPKIIGRYLPVSHPRNMARQIALILVLIGLLIVFTFVLVPWNLRAYDEYASSLTPPMPTPPSVPHGTLRPYPTQPPRQKMPRKQAQRPPEPGFEPEYPVPPGVPQGGACLLTFPCAK